MTGLHLRQNENKQSSISVLSNSQHLTKHDSLSIAFMLAYYYFKKQMGWATFCKAETEHNVHAAADLQN